MLLTISVLSLSYTESDLIFGKSNPKAHVKYRNFAITYLTLKLPCFENYDLDLTNPDTYTC